MHLWSAACGAALDMLVAQTPRAHLGGNNHTVKCVVFGSFLWYLADLYKIWYQEVIFGADFKNFVKFEKFLLDHALFGPFLVRFFNIKPICIKFGTQGKFLALILKILFVFKFFFLYDRTNLKAWGLLFFFNCSYNIYWGETRMRY